MRSTDDEQDKAAVTMLKLLGKSSSINVRKVLWLCAELGLPIEQEQWGSGFRPTQTPEFLALNPNAMVPVLVDGALVLWESNAICRYLAGRQGRGDLLPTAAADRARVEQWMDWQATELNNAWRYAFMSLVRKSPAHTDPQRLAQGVAEWNRHMQILDAQLARTGSHAAGDAFTLADVVLGLSTNRWLMTPMQRPELPALEAYVERLSQRPAFLLHGRNGLP
jgi:glutathione S-transferase